MSSGGVLLIDKPVGPTSHDIVGKVRRALKTRRVGHAGTLDPMASGLLLLCVDDATRVLEYMTAEDKSYTGVVVLGIGTDTDDADGMVVATSSTKGIEDSRIYAAVAALTGKIEQVVPQYSAVHIDGKRAYELARLGQVVDMPSRNVTIHEFTISDIVHDTDTITAKFHVTCSKGTYIRALCRDLGQALDVPAHMSQLRRTAIGATSIDDAIGISELMDCDNPHRYLASPLAYLSAFPSVHVQDALLTRLVQGQRIRVAMKEIEPGNHQGSAGVVMVCHQGELAVIANMIQVSDTAELQPKKVLWKKG